MNDVWSFIAHVWKILGRILFQSKYSLRWEQKLLKLLKNTVSIYPTMRDILLLCVPKLFRNNSLETWNKRNWRWQSILKTRVLNRLEMTNIFQLFSFLNWNVKLVTFDNYARLILKEYTKPFFFRLNLKQTNFLSSVLLQLFLLVFEEF